MLCILVNQFAGIVSDEISTTKRLFHAKMADLPMRLSRDMRAMEDFLLSMNGRSLATMSPPNNFDNDMLSHDMYSFKPGKKTPEAPATTNDFTKEPVFSHGYTSEEEIASPIDADDMSYGSDSNDSVTASLRSEASFPEQLVQSSKTIEQQCNRAQAVTLVPAGKAKVISMPRMVDVPAAPRMRRPATATSVRLPVSRLNRVEPTTQTSSQHSRRSFLRTTSEKLPISTTSSSIAEDPKRLKSVRRRPSLPFLAPTTRSEPSTPNTPLDQTRLPRTADFLKHDPYPSPSTERPTTPMSPSKRRLHKLSSSLALNVFGRGMRRSTSLDTGVIEDLETVKEPEPLLLLSPADAEARQTSHRRISLKPKLVARGANERAPPLVLPPCPEGYDEDEANAAMAQWPARKDSAALISPIESFPAKLPKLHKRQRSVSVSAVLVPTRG